MPIYEYVCKACGQGHEVFQKISDAPLMDCPSCGENELAKVMSSTSFQLKGSGWYVTDFRDKKKDKDKVPEKSADAKTEPSSTSAKTTEPQPSAKSSGVTDT